MSLDDLQGASWESVLQCQNTTIEGKDGDTVILPCSTKNKMDISHEEVWWLFEDPTTGKKTVHLYSQGKEYPHQQSDDFKNRTSLFEEELSSGNCSLRLLVTTSHDGTYQSFVGGHLFSTVNLRVLPEGTNNTSQMHQNVTESPVNLLNDTDGLMTTSWIIGVVATLIMIIMVYLYRKRYKQLCLRKRSNRQTYESVSYHQVQQQPQDEENEPVAQDQNEERILMLEN